MSDTLEELWQDKLTDIDVDRNHPIGKSKKSK